MTTEEVGELIKLGRDGEAAALAVRHTGTEPQRKGGTMGPIEQIDVLLPNFNRLTALAVEGASLDDRTPCDGWAVRDLLGHVNGGARMFAALYTGEPVNERDLGDDPRPVIAEALAGFTTAVKAPGAMDGTVESPFGQMPGEVFCRLAALDILMHTWDLATTLGVAPEVGSEVIESVDGFARQALTADLRRPGLFGDEVVAPEGSAPLDALAAFTGRRA